MKRFIIKTSLYFIPLCCIYGGYIYTHNNISGDIGRLGKIAFGKEYCSYLEQNYLSNNLTIDKLIDSSNNLPCINTSKVITLGDSFSQQGIFGYQNYLAHLLGDSIINIIRNGSKIETAISLLNSNFINRSNCHTFVLECVDRYLISSLWNIDFEIQYTLPENTNMQEVLDVKEESKLHELFSWIRLQFGYDNPIFTHKLKQSCFSHKYYSHTLFRYIDDFNFIETKNTDIEKAKENLILLNQKFSEKEIKLIFLIAADKYDVYRPFMKDDSLPIDTTTDELSNLPGICIINTKPLLQKMVYDGEKDVYMVNDTHWSYKASEVVAQKLTQTIDSLGIVK